MQPLKVQRGKIHRDKEKRGWGTRSLSPCAVSTVALGLSPAVGKGLCIKCDKGSREGLDPGAAFRKQGVDFLVGLGLRLLLPAQGGPSLVPFRELDSMSPLKSLHATTKRFACCK